MILQGKIPSSLDCKSPHTISIDFGMAMLSFVRENFVRSATIAAPPPRRAPGLGVEMYIISSM